jgi:hypothetical protein
MTLELCATFCAGYAYFGTEYAQECFCGNKLLGGSALVENQSDCSSRCVGNDAQFCGAGLRLNLYSALSSTGGKIRTGAPTLTTPARYRRPTKTSRRIASASK